MKKKVDCLCGQVVRVPGYTTEMFCDSCEVRTEFIYVMKKKVDCLCGLVSEFLAAERICFVIPVRYELILFMFCRRK
jgi:hypothetical protein